VEFSVRRPTSKYPFLCTRRKFGFNKKIRRNLLILPTGDLGKYTAHNEYTEEEVRRILPLPPPPPMRCHRLPHTPDAAATLPTVVAPLSCCLHCSANAPTVLPPLTPCCRRRCCAARCCRTAHRHHAAAAPGVAHDAGNKCAAPERAQEGHGWCLRNGRQRPWF
jgi:hypothetical protein